MVGCIPFGVNDLSSSFTVSERLGGERWAPNTGTGKMNEFSRI